MKKKLRIVFNTWTGAMFQKGGGEVQLLQTKAALERLGHEVLLFDQWAPQIDVDVAHQFSIELGVEHFINKYRSAKIPVALSTITWTLPEKNTYHYDRLKYIFDQSGILFPNSRIESERLSGHFDIPIEKFISTRNSISGAYLTLGDAGLAARKFSLPSRFVLSVANIDRRKNTKALAEACSKAGIPLVTVGHVKDPEYYLEFSEMYSEHVHLGPIEDEEVLKSLYSLCDVFALASTVETPGIAALEAASQGAKVVITSEGSTREYFNDQAVYVDYNSISSISSSIREALIQPPKPGFAEYVKEEYTWDKTANEVLEGYTKILSL